MKIKIIINQTAPSLLKIEITNVMFGVMIPISQSTIPEHIKC